MKYVLVGYDRKRAIGAHGTLPWEGRMKTDMRRVKELTTGNAIIMGRKTFESIGRALPNRQNIVVSSHDIDVPGVTRVATLAEAYAAVEPGRKTFLFGGEQIYAASLGDADEILATEIDMDVEDADAFFPELGEEWIETSREHYEASDVDAYPFDFVTYAKRR